MAFFFAYTQVRNNAQNLAFTCCIGFCLVSQSFFLYRFFFALYSPHHVPQEVFLRLLQQSNSCVSILGLLSRLPLDYAATWNVVYRLKTMLLIKAHNMYHPRSTVIPSRSVSSSVSTCNQIAIEETVFMISSCRCGRQLLMPMSRFEAWSSHLPKATIVPLAQYE